MIAVKRPTLLATPEDLGFDDNDDLARSAPSLISEDSGGDGGGSAEGRGGRAIKSRRVTPLTPAALPVTPARTPELTMRASGVLKSGSTVRNIFARVTYTIVRQLGAGTGGTVYSASIDGSQTPAVALKRFIYVPLDEQAQRRDIPVFTYESSDDALAAARAEFSLLRVITRRSQRLMCASDVVCADALFQTSPNETFLVFPYIEAKNLQQYTDEVLHPMSIVPKRQRAFVHDALHIIENVLRIVARLEAISVAHVDLKPANILITPAGVVKLIDFGIGCNFPDELDDNPLQEDVVTTACKQRYATTLAYQDPQASKLRPSDTVPMQRLYQAFALYSIGKMLQLLFDAAQQPQDKLVVRATTLMPSYVLKIIQSMTQSDVLARRTPAEYAERLQIARQHYLADAHANELEQRRRGTAEMRQ